MRFCFWAFWSWMSAMILHSSRMMITNKIWHLSNDLLDIVFLSGKCLFEIILSLNFILKRVSNFSVLRCRLKVYYFFLTISYTLSSWGRKQFLRRRKTFANGLGWSTCFDEPMLLTQLSRALSYISKKCTNFLSVDCFWGRVLLRTQTEAIAVRLNPLPCSCFSQ